MWVREHSSMGEGTFGYGCVHLGVGEGTFKYG